SDAGAATAARPPATGTSATGGGGIAPEVAPAEADRLATEREMSIVGGSIVGEISGPGILQVGETAVIDVRFTSRVSEERLAIAIVIRDAADSMLFGISTLQLGDIVSVVPGAYDAQFRFCNHLAPGSYRVDAALHRKNATGEIEIDVRTTLIAFDVVDILTKNFSGRFHLSVEADVLATTPEARVERTPTDTGSWPLRRRNPALSDFRACLEQLADIDGLPRASDTIVRVRVTNLGAERWPAFGRRPVRVAYHWQDERGTVVEYEGLRSMLPRDVAPGESLAIDCFLRAPDAAGDRLLVWTLLQEEVAWFDEVDRSSQCTVRMAIT